MHKMFVALSLGMLGLAATGCSSAPAGTSFSVLESCFDTGGGHVQCVPTPNGPQTQPTDVNHDGVADTFVCASGPAGADDHDADDRDHDGVADDQDCDDKGCDEHHGGRGPDASGDDDHDDLVCPAATI